MKNTKQYRKLNNLQVKAEKCLTREEAKKIIDKANKTQDKIGNQFTFLSIYICILKTIILIIYIYLKYFLFTQIQKYLILYDPDHYKNYIDLEIIFFD